jgi:hypothetical protein
MPHCSWLWLNVTHTLLLPATKNTHHTDYNCNGYRHRTCTFGQSTSCLYCPLPCGRTEVQQDIDKLSAKYFRYQLRGGGNTQDHIPAKIAAEYATLSALADEKRALADRLAVLISRSRARLDYDLQRMLKLTGENPGIRTSLSMGGPTPMTAIVNHLQASLAPAEAISASVPPPTKRACFAAKSSLSCRLFTSSRRSSDDCRCNVRAYVTGAGQRSHRSHHSCAEIACRFTSESRCASVRCCVRG